jgi:esterase/lipase superfamily enzyme
MASDVQVWFATNRRLTDPTDGWYGDTFHGDGPEFYRVGTAGVASDGKTYKVREVETFNERKPPRDVGLDSKAVLGSTQLFADLKQKMRDGQDLIVLIHGYASGFSDALERAAELTEKYLVRGKDGKERQPIVLVFSWPSNGRMIPFKSYVSDRSDAEKSGHALARLFFRLIDFYLGEAEKARVATTEDGQKRHAPCPGRIHLVAHSMGNWALRAGLLHAIDRRGADNLPILFDNVFLMAADEDEDALEDPRKLGLLPRMANAVHVYHSKDDTALVISDVTKLNPDRLGHNGPEDIEVTDGKVVAIDCRHVDSTDLLHADHQYYRLRKEVIEDVKAVLAGTVPFLIDRRRMLDHPRRWLIEKA